MKKLIGAIMAGGMMMGGLMLVVPEAGATGGDRCFTGKTYCPPPPSNCGVQPGVKCPEPTPTTTTTTPPPPSTTVPETTTTTEPELETTTTAPFETIPPVVVTRPKFTG